MVFLALLLATISAWSCWCLAVHLPRASGADRACGALLAWIWIATALFIGLSAFRAFTVIGALTSWSIVAAASHLAARGRRPWATLIADASQLVDLTRRMSRSRAAPLLGLALVVLGASVVRGMLAPSLAWDDLTYHLFRAARWAQQGGFAIEPAPNAWGYSEYFPPVGDIVWSWAMLPVHDDSLIVFAGLAIFALLAVSVYAAVAGGADDERAVLAAATTVTTPSIAHYLGSGYVDPLSTALFAASVRFCQRAVTLGSGVDVVLLMGTLGLAAGVKVSNLAFVAPGVVVALLVLTRQRCVRQQIGWGVAGLCAGAISAPFFLRAWQDMGSPSYPVPVEIAGRTIFAGNFWQQQIFSGAMGMSDDSLAHLLWALFIPDPAAIARDGQFINPGPGTALLIVAAVGGAVALLRRRKERAAWLYVIAAAALVGVSAFGANAVNLRATMLVTSFGRFLGVIVVAAGILTSASGRRWLVPLALAINVLLSVPLGWSQTDLRAIAAAAPRVLPLVVLAAVVLVIAVRVHRGDWGCAGALVCCTAAVGLASPVRQTFRYDYFRDAAAGSAFTVNRDVRTIAFYWPLWRHMDREAPLQLAVAAGWPGMSPIGPRYPLLGARLQNRISYVPLTASATVADTPVAFARPEEGDYDAWLARLFERRIDYLVVLTPAIEGWWARNHPDVFLPEPVGEFEIYRIIRPGS